MDDYTTVFVVDRTFSMSSALDEMCRFVVKYALAHPFVTQLGLVTVDDHYSLDPLAIANLEGSLVAGRTEEFYKRESFLDPNQACKSYGVTSNLEEFVYWMQTIPLGHGGDLAEAFHCGLKKAVQLRPNKIWVVTDSVPRPGNPCMRDRCLVSMPKTDTVSVLAAAHVRTEFITPGWELFFPDIKILSYREAHELVENGPGIDEVYE